MRKQQFNIAVTTCNSKSNFTPLVRMATEGLEACLHTPLARHSRGCPNPRASILCTPRGLKISLAVLFRRRPILVDAG